MDAFSPIGILAGIVTNILSNKTEKSLDSAWQILLHRLKGDQSPSTNNLEDALRCSFFSALQILALECRQELLGSSIMKYRGQPVYLPEHQEELEWLDGKIKQLAITLKQFKCQKTMVNPLIFWEEIEFLLTPSAQITEQNLQIIKEKLITVALANDAHIPVYYENKVREALLTKISEHLASQVQNQPSLRHLFEVKMLTQINATLTEQNLKIQGLEKSLSSSSTATARWEVKLDVDIQKLETVPLEEIVNKLKQLSGDGSLTIRIIEDGSIILVFEGSETGFQKIQALFNQGQLTELLGVPIQNICLESEILPLSPAINSINLSQWLQNIIDTGWQTVEEVFGTKQGSFVLATARIIDHPERIVRAKLIELETKQGLITLALVVDMITQAEKPREIHLKIYPTGANIYLPEQLEASLFDSSGNKINFLQSQYNNQYLQFDIYGQQGEAFRVEIKLETACIIQSFII